MTNLKTAYERATLAYETIEAVNAAPEHDLPFDEQLVEIVDQAEAVSEWLAEAKPYLDKKLFAKLKRLVTKTMNETVTLAELRELQPTYEQAREQVSAATDALDEARLEAEAAFEELD